MGNASKAVGARSTQEDLDAINRQIAALAAELNEATGRVGELIAGDIRGEEGAAAKLASLDAEIEQLQERLAALRQQQSAMGSEIRGQSIRAAHVAIEERPRKVAELVQRRLVLIREAERYATKTAAALKALAANGQELAEELDQNDIAGRRFFSFSAFIHRARAGVARLFLIDPRKQMTAENNLLGISSNEIGARAWMTPVERETEGLADIVPLFLSREDAEAARWQRARVPAKSFRVGENGPEPLPDDPAQAERAKAWIIVMLPGSIYTLVAAEHAFGDLESARRAVRGRALVPLAQGRGYVLVPERFAGGMAA